MSESLENRADDGTREVGGDAVEGVDVLLEERGRVGHVAPAGGVVFLAEQQARVLPQHFVLAHVAQLDPRRHRQGVAGRDLLRAEGGGHDRNRADLADQERVDAGLLRQDLVPAAADELRAHLLRHQRLEVEDRGAVHERRDADRLDVFGQERSAPCERVAAAGAAETRRTKDTEATKATKKRPESGIMPSDHRISPFVSSVSLVLLQRRYWTTTLTSGPLATTTFRIVFPAVCPLTAASASARSRSSSSDASARAVTRARTLPLICTGTTTSSAFATAGSNVGHAALVRPSAWPSLCQSSSAVCGANGDSMTTSASMASRSTEMVCVRSMRPTGASPRVGKPCAVASLKS